MALLAVGRLVDVQDRARGAPPRVAPAGTSSSARQVLAEVNTATVEQRDMVRDYAAGYDAYVSQKWDGAIAAWARSADKGDGTARMMQSRALKFKAKPDAAFDGVWKWETK